ncbi:hypothetical protein [Deinococcus maricopensis]|uniref:Uncharacterized protein n=1 Tax=Deinococcus maricopensis (strain DSM 21211 / LMG 22137 / NRRL B-23946 / LB-34) TaxID=709986 RepID=E8U8F9_DEIML|nr:hypothetical protein [Deinococcus maricopensis]ADV67348.1 hypothetical protein Deima_1699 [Deinococcus maricopensis DSM 21211]
MAPLPARLLAVLASVLVASPALALPGLNGELRVKSGASPCLRVRVQVWEDATRTGDVYLNPQGAHTIKLGQGLPTFQVGHTYRVNAACLKATGAGKVMGLNFKADSRLLQVEFLPDGFSMRFLGAATCSYKTGTCN